MSGIVTFAKSRPLSVGLRQHCGKALVSVVPDLIWQRRYLESPGLRAAGIVSTSPQNPTILRCRRTLFIHAGVRRPFNAHRAGVVGRFSPIHF
jgi:hypothetical protein